LLIFPEKMGKVNSTFSIDRSGPLWILSGCDG
jgi:hypothetical protein